MKRFLELPKSKGKKRVTFLLMFILVFSFSFNVATNTTYAEEETEIEEVDLDCGNFDFTCKIREFMLDLAQSGINFAIDRLNDFIVTPGEVLFNDAISSFYNQAYSFFYVLLGVIFLYKLIEMLALADPESRNAIREKLVVLVFTVAFASSFKWIFEKLLTLNNYFVKAITQGGKVNFNDFKMSYTEDFMAGGANTALSVTLVAILLLVMLILYLVLVFQMAIRFAELGFAIAIAPICIATNLTDNFNLLPSFWRNLLSIIFTQAVQYMLIIFMITFFTESSIYSPKGIIYAIGYMFLVIKAPQVIKEMLYSSGSGRAAAGMASNAGSAMVREVIRRKSKVG
ncbi:conjugal transfer protein TrbL family protein [Priestia endophytica]